MVLSETQVGGKTRGASVLPKTTGVFALLLFLLASVGQAFHSHQPLRGGAKSLSHAEVRSAFVDTGTDDGSAETCPLCVAMHSATPTSRAVHAPGFLVVARAAAEPAEVFRDEQVAFARLSRPPPVL